MGTASQQEAQKGPSSTCLLGMLDRYDEGKRQPSCSVLCGGRGLG